MMPAVRCRRKGENWLEQMKVAVLRPVRVSPLHQLSLHARRTTLLKFVASGCSRRHKIAYQCRECALDELSGVGLSHFLLFPYWAQ